MKIKNRVVRMKIDTGADVNILDEQTYKIIKDVVQLKKPGIKLHGYSSEEPLRTIGKFKDVVETKNKIVVAESYVVSGRSGSLLSAETAEALELIKFANVVTKSSIVEQYPKVFKGIGRLKNTQIKLHIDKDITPVVQPCRWIPLAMRQRVKDELD